jgi:hypothetical protein
MATASSDLERAAQLEAQGRLFLNLATQVHDRPIDLDSLLHGCNGDQMKKS